MNFTSHGIQFLIRPARAMAFLGCISVFMRLNAALLAAEPLPATTQSNAVATGSNPEARTNATPVAAQPATNGLKAAPITNTAAAATNLTQTGATNSAFVLDDKHKLAIGDRLSFCAIWSIEYWPSLSNS